MDSGPSPNTGSNRILSWLTLHNTGETYSTLLPLLSGVKNAQISVIDGEMKIQFATKSYATPVRFELHKFEQFRFEKIDVMMDGQLKNQLVSTKNSIIDKQSFY